MSGERTEAAGQRRELEELRRLGRDRGLRDALLGRIDDRLTAEDPAVLRGLRQARNPRQKHYVHRAP